MGAKNGTDWPDAKREIGPYRHDVIDATGVRVSTIFRESSADYGSPYFETMAFPLSGDAAILWHSSAHYERAADRLHELAVRWFSRPWRVALSDHA
jgi:hypothetical protein